MKLAAYPPQEPLSPLGAAYQARVLERGAGIEGEEVSYGADPYQSVAVHSAPRPSGDVLVFLHGGGWTNGYKEWMSFMAPALTAAGVTFITAGYRLAPAHLFPAGFDDCADALARVHARIASFGGDPRRLFVGGHSAGGHYAALLAVKSAWRTVRGLPTRPLAGCIPVSGVYRFGPDSGLSVRPRFLGADPDADMAASPIRHIDRTAAPPFLLARGSKDFSHLIRQADEMRTALEAAGVLVEEEVIEGCDHFEASLACGDTTRSWVGRAVSWMKKQPPTSEGTT